MIDVDCHVVGVGVVIVVVVLLLLFTVNYSFGCRLFPRASSLLFQQNLVIFFGIMSSTNFIPTLDLTITLLVYTSASQSGNIIILVWPKNNKNIIIITILLLIGMS
jgi:hypothetical protein